MGERFVSVESGIPAQVLYTSHDHGSNDDFVTNSLYVASHCNVRRESIGRKRPQFWQRVDWHLLHDNASAHRSELVKELTKTCTKVFPHTPYSSDLALCDICLFASMKNNLQKRHFVSSDEVKVASQQALRDVAKKGFQQQ
ncbi:hypothetical protein TNCV_4769071 [Trichonephila clavipes]|nr:hypothetical protein TNCV_4769071 [Trichonephila clavipes]